MLTYTFKRAYTTESKVYSFEPGMTIADFIDAVVSRAKIDFGMSNVEVVESGQYDNANGRDPELAPAVQSSTQITVGETYNPQTTAFYIRGITS